MCIRDSGIHSKTHGSAVVGICQFTQTESKQDSVAGIPICSPQRSGVLLVRSILHDPCLLYTSDAADERSSVDLGGRRIIKKKKKVIQRHACHMLSRKQR